MTVRTLKFALASSDIPFISTQQPRTVIVGELDNQGKAARDSTGAQSGYGNNTVQVVYAENVMPTAYGWSSVSYASVVTAPSADLAYIGDAGAAPVAGAIELQTLRSSDPNGYELGAHNAVELPSNSDSMLCLSFMEGGETRVWIRYPISYTPAYTKWRPLRYWQDGPTLTALTSATATKHNTVSIAAPTGIQFVCLPGAGLFYVGTVKNPTDTVSPFTLEFNAVKQYCFGAAAVNAIVLEQQFIANFSVDPTTVTCIASSNGYLLAAYDNVIAWALASGNIFDFAPVANAVATGADSRIPEELIGTITALIPISGGFIIFSEQNAVAAIYSSTNFTNPWTFREISGCGGIQAAKNVAKADSQGAVYAMTSVGLQRITLTGATDLNPACSDYLSGRKIELFDPASGNYELYSLQSDLTVGCNLVGSRYLCVSVGVEAQGEYSLALVYDLQLRRWGKLRQLHRAVCELHGVDTSEDMLVSDFGEATIESLPEDPISSFVTDVSDQYTESRQQLGILLPTGEVLQAAFAPGASSADAAGLITLGQLQLSRSKETVLHNVEIEGARTTTCAVRPSYNGRTLETKLAADTWMLTESTDDYQKWSGFSVAKSFTLEIGGSFDLSTVIAKLDVEGLV